MIQLSPRFLFGLFVLGVAFLLLPDRVADFLGFTSIRTQYRGFVGIGTLAALIFCAVQLFPLAVKSIGGGRARNQTLASLDSLSVEERLLLAYCFFRGQKTVTLSFVDGVARGVSQRGFLLLLKGRAVFSNGPLPSRTMCGIICVRTKGGFWQQYAFNTAASCLLQQLDEHISRHRRW